MAVVVTVLKYIFVVGLGIEVLIILRALVGLAREKAQQPLAPTETQE